MGCRDTQGTGAAVSAMSTHLITLVQLDGAPSSKDSARAMRSHLGVPWTGKVGLGVLQGTSTLSPVPGSFAEGHIEKERRGRRGKGKGGVGGEGRGGEKREEVRRRGEERGGDGRGGEKKMRVSMEMRVCCKYE